MCDTSPKQAQRKCSLSRSETSDFETRSLERKIPEKKLMTCFESHIRGFFWSPLVRTRVAGERGMQDSIPFTFSFFSFFGKLDAVFYDLKVQICEAEWQTEADILTSRGQTFAPKIWWWLHIDHLLPFFSYDRSFKIAETGSKLETIQSSQSFTSKSKNFMHERLQTQGMVASLCYLPDVATSRLQSKV